MPGTIPKAVGQWEAIATAGGSTNTAALALREVTEWTAAAAPAPKDTANAKRSPDSESPPATVERPDLLPREGQRPVGKLRQRALPGRDAMRHLG